MVDETAEVRIRVSHGPRAVEAGLLEEVLAEVARGHERPELLAQPVRIVVPSKSLRLHLATRLVARDRRALAGVTIQTLHGLAQEIVERAGAPTPDSDALFPVVVRQVAAAEPLLREELDELVDGYAPVRSVVDDLLDAGFDAASPEPLHDLLAEEGGGATVARAKALVNVATGVLARLATEEIGHRSLLLEAAADALEKDPERALPMRAVWIHGFAEVTGRRGDLLRGLVLHRGARAWLDAPRDPADTSRPDPGVVFLDRLRERLEGLAPLEEETSTVPPAEVAAFCAPGASAEAREVAERVRALHEEEGLPYASIGVVARDLAAHRGALRRQFLRLGVPFSGVGELGSVTPEARRSAALLELLEDGPRVPADRWLDAVVAFAPAMGAAPPDPGLRLALRHVGAVRLGDIEGLTPGPRGVLLPTARGSDLPEAEREAARIGPERLRGAMRAAADLLGRLRTLRGAGDAKIHAVTLEGLTRDALGWPEDSRALAAISELREELPEKFALEGSDFTTLVRRKLERFGREPIGGSGGGVQLLSVMEARARTFEALFVIGLNRDAFPRSISEDPLLPDDLRLRAKQVLGDLPVKRTGFDEERYLFAQLAGASPRLTLSWQVCDDDGKARTPSSFVERPGLWEGGPEAERVASCAARGRGETEGPMSADELAVAAGLEGDAAGFAECLEVALGALPELEAFEPAALAAARCRILDEQEGRGDAWQSMGPYLGRVGAGAADRSRSGRPLYVTTLEGMARCGWQALLRRHLRIEPPVDPLQALPGIDNRVVGIATHGALAALVHEAVGEEAATLEEVRGLRPVRIAWPGDEELRERALAAAREALREEGVALAGLEGALARRVTPYLVRAREIDRADDTARGVVGAEVSGTTRAGPEGREIGFRVDRVDVVGEGEEATLRLTDYKTGKPLSEAVREVTRRNHFLAAVGMGQNLQAPVYAAGAPGEGRFVYLLPDLEEPLFVQSTDADDVEMNDGLALSLEATLGAWEAGAFPPRLLDAKLEKESKVCGSCEVAPACLRQDSGVRRRLERWLRAAGERPPSDPGGHAYFEVWRRTGPW
jgi:hypothetical protein